MRHRVWLCIELWIAFNFLLHILIEVTRNLEVHFPKSFREKWKWIGLASFKWKSPTHQGWRWPTTFPLTVKSDNWLRPLIIVWQRIPRVIGPSIVTPKFFCTAGALSFDAAAAVYVWPSLPPWCGVVALLQGSQDPSINCLSLAQLVVSHFFLEIFVYNLPNRENRQSNWHWKALWKRISVIHFLKINFCYQKLSLKIQNVEDAHNFHHEQRIGRPIIGCVGENHLSR